MVIFRKPRNAQLKISMKLLATLLLASVMLLLINSVAAVMVGASITPKASAANNAEPPAVSYTSFDGDTLTLYAYVGDQVALLAPSSSLDPTIVDAILDTFDGIYTYYAQATGRTPTLYRQYEGRGTVAVVPSTCGAGCGYLGLTGIELLNETFDRLYTGVRDRNEYDQVIFYEFGRNFWFYGDQLEYRGADDTGAVTTGYAVFMRFMALKSTGVAPGPFDEHDFTYFENEVVGLLDRYLADSSYTWDNTLRAGSAPPNPIGLGATDLFAAFLFDLRSRFGTEFINQIWQEVALRPTAATTQAAVDNFILAASITANQNLAELFVQHYRWPISPSAQQELAQRFSPTATSTNTSTPPPTFTKTVTMVPASTSTSTNTPTFTPTSTHTPSNTPTNTPVPTTSTNTPTPTPIELPPTGGTVVATMDRLQLTFALPPGAVNESIRVTIKMADSPPATSGFQALSPIFTIEAVTGNGLPVTQFAKPFTLTIRYTDADIQGLEESRLTLHYWNEAQQAWIAIPTTVNIENNILTATLDHLTVFAVLQERTDNPMRLFLPLVRR